MSALSPLALLSRLRLNGRELGRFQCRAGGPWRAAGGLTRLSAGALERSALFSGGEQLEERREVATASLQDETLAPHSLRHGFGSIMRALGHATKTVSNWLGHTRVSTTERWYAHQIEAMQDEAGSGCALRWTSGAAGSRTPVQRNVAVTRAVS